MSSLLFLKRVLEVMGNGTAWRNRRRKSQSMKGFVYEDELDSRPREMIADREERDTVDRQPIPPLNLSRQGV